MPHCRMYTERLDETLQRHVQGVDMLSCGSTLFHVSRRPRRSAMTEGPTSVSFSGRLLSAAIEALAAPRCSPPARDVVLDTLESLLDSDDTATAAIVQRHTGAVLEALKALVLRALGPGQAGAAANTPVVSVADCSRLLQSAQCLVHGCSAANECSRSHLVESSAICSAAYVT